MHAYLAYHSTRSSCPTHTTVRRSQKCTASLAYHFSTAVDFHRPLQMVFSNCATNVASLIVPISRQHCPGAATAAPRAAAKDAHTDGRSLSHVHLMRGLMNVFSLGIDQLAVLIARHGIEASVHNHAEANACVSEYRRRAIVRRPRTDYPHRAFARRRCSNDYRAILGPGRIPVALVVPFDGTDSYAAPKNVACVPNITQRTFDYMRSGAGFHGELPNVNVSGETGIDHFTIDKSPQLRVWC